MTPHPPHRSTADRIRPILQAMEESIKSARRNRVKTPAPLTTSPQITQNTHHPMGMSNVVKPMAPPHSQSPAIQINREPVSDGPQRLKAKPKRVGSPFPSPFEQPNYRSQTG
jgi:hypothetical protein